VPSFVHNTIDNPIFPEHVAAGSRRRIDYAGPGGNTYF
jgi:hypothetical protein